MEITQKYSVDEKAVQDITSRLSGVERDNIQLRAQVDRLTKTIERLDSKLNETPAEVESYHHRRVTKDANPFTIRKKKKRYKRVIPKFQKVTDVESAEANGKSNHKSPSKFQARTRQNTKLTKTWLEKIKDANDDTDTSGSICNDDEQKPFEGRPRANAFGESKMVDITTRVKTKPKYVDYGERFITLEEGPKNTFEESKRTRFYVDSPPGVPPRTYKTPEQPQTSSRCRSNSTQGSPKMKTKKKPNGEDDKEINKVQEKVLKMHQKKFLEAGSMSMDRSIKLKNINDSISGKDQNIFPTVHPHVLRVRAITDIQPMVQELSKNTPLKYHGKSKSESDNLDQPEWPNILLAGNETLKRYNSTTGAGLSLSTASEYSTSRTPTDSDSSIESNDDEEEVFLDQQENRTSGARTSGYSSAPDSSLKKRRKPPNIALALRDIGQFLVNTGLGPDARPLPLAIRRQGTKSMREICNSPSFKKTSHAKSF